MSAQSRERPARHSEIMNRNPDRPEVPGKRGTAPGTAGPEDLDDYLTIRKIAAIVYGDRGGVL